MLLTHPSHIDWRSDMKTSHPARLMTCVTVAFLTMTASTLATPPDRTPPTTPTNLRVTGVSDYSVSLAWNASSDNSGFWYYRLVSSAGVTVSLDRTQTSYTFSTNHVAGNTYSFYVFAVDGR